MALGMPSTLRRCLPRGLGGARNLVNKMVSGYPPRLGGASLEGWEGHETLYLVGLRIRTYGMAGMVDYNTYGMVRND
eukprot:465023-Pyramimonas_sp.AAC.1